MTKQRDKKKFKQQNVFDVFAGIVGLSLALGIVLIIRNTDSRSVIQTMLIGLILGLLVWGFFVIYRIGRKWYADNGEYQETSSSVPCYKHQKDAEGAMWLSELLRTMHDPEYAKKRELLKKEQEDKLLKQLFAEQPQKIGKTICEKYNIETLKHKDPIDLSLFARRFSIIYCLLFIVVSCVIFRASKNGEIFMCVAMCAASAYMLWPFYVILDRLSKKDMITDISANIEKQLCLRKRQNASIQNTIIKFEQSKKFPEKRSSLSRSMREIELFRAVIPRKTHKRQYRHYKKW